MIGLAMMLAAAGPVVLIVEGSPCVTTIEGAAVVDRKIAKVMRKLKARRRGVLIKFVGDVPDKCADITLYLMDRLKVKRVTFDPPYLPT